ncbi:MAG: hypothetical protein D8H98_04445 [Prevotella sp.]|nr:MAG: hypothetical protein D8H98_04445 [Prevotella sp.]
MNREIKFRGRPTGKGGVWMIGIGAYKTHTAEHLVLNAKGDSVEVVHLCQYTGLKDKNGKEIYEGDILSFTVFDAFGGDRQYRGTVRYCGSRFMIWLSLDGEVCLDLDWVIEQDDELEIIGNIYDNPELIKQ